MQPVNIINVNKFINMTFFGMPLTFSDQIIKKLEWDRVLNRNVHGRIPNRVGHQPEYLYKMIVQFDFKTTESELKTVYYSTWEAFLFLGSFLGFLLPTVYFYFPVVILVFLYYLTSII